MTEEMQSVIKEAQRIATETVHDDFIKLQFFAELKKLADHNLNWAFIWNIYNLHDSNKKIKDQLKEKPNGN